MIRRLKIGLVCVMFLMTGCIGGGSTGTISNSGEVVQVTFWHYYSGDTKSQMDLIIEEFNKTIGLEKGIEVTGYASDSITQLENDVLESALGVVYASEMPDVFLSYEDKALELNELGAIIDFNEYLTPEELSVIEPAFLEEGQFNEIQGILPFVKSTELLMLNDTAWQEFASVSGRTYDDLLTWEGIEEVSQEYYEYTEGKSFFGIDSLENFVVVASKGFGVEIFQGESQETVLDDEALYKIFAYYVENYALSYVMQEAQFRSDDIRIGNIIAYVGSSASAMYFPTWIETEEGTQEISLKVLPYPAFEGTTPYALSQGAGLVISESNEEQEAAAVEFVKFLMERNISFALQTSYIPVASSYY
ncbi:MAG: extracellular solute-binding protein, partial [Eubacteriales bacterium]